MNILKTPREKLLEENGMVPPSPGMLKTPQQLLLEESGAMPNVYADGGQVTQLSPEMLRALIEAYRQYLNVQAPTKEPINQTAAEPVVISEEPQPKAGGLATLASIKPAKKAARKLPKKIKK
jgi:hypothetical protein